MNEINEIIDSAELPELLANYSLDDTNKVFEILADRFYGISLAKKLASFGEALKTAGNNDSAQWCFTSGMMICLITIEVYEESEEIGKDDYVDELIDEYRSLLSAFINLHTADDDTGNVMQYCIGLSDKADELGEKLPETGTFRMLAQLTLENGATYYMKKNNFSKVVELYIIQRDKLVDYSKYMRVTPLIAKVDSKLVLPCMMTGNVSLAKHCGEEAYELYVDLFESDPERYAADFIASCANYGGVCMDTDALDNAKAVLDAGYRAWVRLSEKMRNDSDVVLGKYILDTNNERMKRKMNS